MVQTDGACVDITRFGVRLEQRALEHVVQVKGSTSAHHVDARWSPPDYQGPRHAPPKQR